MNFYFRYLLLLVCSFLFSGVIVSCGSDDDDDDDSSSSSYAYRHKIKEAGETYLMNNREKDGVVETYSGLQYKIDTLGTGKIPIATDSVKMTFAGQLYNGTYFCNETSTLLVEDQIAGMQEALMMMPEGSVFDVWIPYYLAYNAESHTYYYNSQMVSISAYSMLHFHVKINKVITNYIEEE